MSNFIGYMLDQCVEKGFQAVLLWGHYGKLVKLAAGNFNTHSRITDAKLETLTAITAVCGGKIIYSNKSFMPIPPKRQLATLRLESRSNSVGPSGRTGIPASAGKSKKSFGGLCAFRSWGAD